MQYALNKLYNPHTGKGLFPAMGMDRLCELVGKAHVQIDQMAFDLDQFMGEGRPNLRVQKTNVVPNSISDVLDEIREHLTKMSDAAEDASRRQDLMSASGRLESLAGDVRAWLKHSLEDNVYWLERVLTRRGDLRVEMHAAPIDVSHRMREMLFQKVPSVIMASATVSTGRSGGFEFFQSRIGASGSLTSQLGSPFDYQKQAELVVVGDMPDPSSQREEYERLLPEDDQALSSAFEWARICAVHQLRTAALDGSKDAILVFPAEDGALQPSRRDTARPTARAIQESSARRTFRNR